MIVDFKHPRFVVFIQKNINSENLENFTLWLNLSEFCLHLMLNHIPENLHNTLASIIDIFFNGSDIDSLFLKLFPESC